MIKAVKDLYKTTDLDGEALCLPLKRYHQFFQGKINNSEGLAKGAWLAANVFTGVVFYPLLGSLAGTGLFIKLRNVSSLDKHNEDLFTRIEDLRRTYQEIRSLDSDFLNAVDERVRYKNVVVSTIDVLRDDFEGQLLQVEQEIRAKRAEFRKVSLAMMPTLNQERAVVGTRLQLLTSDPDTEDGIAAFPPWREITEDVKNLYLSPDLPGEDLFVPMKRTYHVFQKREAGSEGFVKIAWIAAHVVLGIFAYPVFGALALLGMPIKLTGVTALQEGNRRKIRVQLDSAFVGYSYCEGFSDRTSDRMYRRGYAAQPPFERVEMRKDNVASACRDVWARARVLNDQFRKIFFEVKDVNSPELHVPASSYVLYKMDPVY